MTIAEIVGRRYASATGRCSSAREGTGSTHRIALRNHSIHFEKP